MTTQRYFFTSLFMLLASPIFAQSLSSWGKVDPLQLNIRQHTAFPDADAVILENNGRLSVQQGHDGYEFLLNRYVRIQILTEAGAEWANRAIPYYAKDDFYRIRNLKAQSHYLENGQHKTASLDRKDFFTEKLDEEYSILKFALPQARPGAILEYEYDLVKQSVYTYAFYFQDDLPVLRSEFQFITARNLNYIFFSEGLASQQVERTGENRWLMKNLPAAKEEPYIANLEDYKSKMIMQLTAYLANGRKVETLNSWDDLAEEIFSDWGLKKMLKKNKKLDPIAQIQLAGQNTPEEKLLAVYNHIRDHMEWNGDKEMFSERKLDQVYESKEGSSGEINLLLTYFLRQAGIKANPMLMSTRRHGKPIKQYPLLAQFNTLACYAELGKKSYVLDATHPYRTIDLPSISDLNDDGYLLDLDNPRWIAVPRDYPSQKYVMAQMEIGDDGSIEGKFNLVARGYKAVDYRTTIHNKSEDELISSIFSDNMAEGEVIDYSIKDATDAEKPLKIEAHIRTEDYANVTGDHMYIDPLMMFRMGENPFLEPERIYPIDFIHNSEDRLILTLKIPEGYEVESIPKNSRIALPNRDMIFDFKSEEEAGVVSIQYLLARNKAHYPATAYNSLKVLYDKIMLRQSEKIVLKKKS